MSLVYYPDSNPGIARRRCGRGFSYIAPDGTRIDDPEERSRLAALAVPPAYEKVWMAPMAQAHLLATGRDARGRKQYRYHPQWSAVRQQRKFDVLPQIADALPALRRWISDRLKGDPGTKDTALAAALALIDRAAMRPGDAAYTAANGSHGALTLEDRHLTREGDAIMLDYVAKGGRRVAKRLRGPQLARTLAASADLPGSRLFEYRTSSGELVPLRSEHLIEVMAAIGGEELTPKALRTWAGTHAAFGAIRQAQGQVQIRDMAAAAAERLHNTPTIARASYIHPKVIGLADADQGDLLTVRRLRDDGPAEFRRDEPALRTFLLSGDRKDEPAQAACLATKNAPPQ